MYSAVKTVPSTISDYIKFMNGEQYGKVKELKGLYSRDKTSRQVSEHE